jgi:hypothetical protein
MVRLFKRLLPLVLVLGVVATSPKPAEAGSSGVCEAIDRCSYRCLITPTSGAPRPYIISVC